MTPHCVRGLAAGVLAFSFAALVHAQSDASAGAPVAADFPPEVQDVIKMAKAGVGESVILAQVKSTGQSFRLTADQIITLTQDGVPQAVIQALLATSAPPSSAAEYISGPPAPPAPPPDTPTNDASASDLAPPAPPPGEAASTVDFNTFWANLYPYGTWVQLPGFGWCWRPAVASAPGWRPYVDDGQWVSTDAGWFWQSNYPWGDYVFHYGRWMTYPGYGWVWYPDTVWGPAWVCWREDDAAGICGWAPLPPGVRFFAGVGLFYNGQVGFDIDFGLGPDAFVFCPFGYLVAPDWRAHLYPADRAPFLYAHSVVHNGYRVDGGRLLVGGIPPARIALAAHQPVAPVAAAAVWKAQETAHSAIRAEDVRPSAIAPVPDRSYRPAGGYHPYSEAGYNRPPGPYAPTPARPPAAQQRAPAPSRAEATSRAPANSSGETRH